MKGLLPKILFYYSALASLFIAVSLALTSRSIGPLIFAILFLPIAAYFVSEFFKHLRREPNDFRIPKGGETVFILIVFLVLLGLGIRNIYANKNPGNNLVTPSPTTSSSPLIFKTASGSAGLSKLQISITDGSSSVNIREKPTIYSKVVATAKDGDTFSFVQKADGWYEINFTTGGTGFISLKYVKEVGK